MELGKYIETLRKNKNMSIGDLSKKTGLSKGYLHSLENGGIANPGIMTLKNIANALVIQLYEIVSIVDNVKAHDEAYEPLGFD